MNITARNLINQAFQLIGVTQISESPSVDDTNSAVFQLQIIFDAWAADGLKVYATSIDTFSFTAGVQQYTFGPTGTWASARANRIKEISYNQSTLTYPMERLNTTQWSQIAIKSVSGLPTSFWSNNEYPNETLFIWPVPQSNLPVTIYSEKLILDIVDLDTAVDLPAGYTKALLYSLAIELCALYGKPVAQELVAQARTAVAAIKRNNVEVPVSELVTSTENNIPYPQILRGY